MHTLTTKTSQKKKKYMKKLLNLLEVDKKLSI